MNIAPKTMNAAPKKRSADRTRTHILDIAYQEMYQKGFQGLRVDEVLEKAKLTKGAFYHHFSSKQELGFAVIDEVVSGFFQVFWIDALERSVDPVETIKLSIKNMSDVLGQNFVTLGCPLNNLSQEMSSLDEGFRSRITAIYKNWRSCLEQAFERGKKEGTIGLDIDAKTTSLFITASIEGCIGMAKSEQDQQMLFSCIGELSCYLDGLRP